MSPTDLHKDSKLLTANQQAAQWLITLEIDKSDNAEDYVAFMEWLEESPRHEELYERCLRTWKSSESLPITSEDTLPILEGIDLSDKESGEKESTRKSRYIVGIKPLALCASLVFAFAIFLVLVLPQSEAVLYQTNIGEQQRIELEDGSFVTLNTASRIAVKYQPSGRNVVLEKGEALFDVAKDSERPFVVEVGNTQVEALGTLFNINKGADTIAITLAEGSVRLLPTIKNQDLAEALLSPGQQAIVEFSGAIDNIQSSNTDEVTQWVSGKLAFRDAKLEDVIFEVNKYSKTKIYMTDPALKEVEISAYFYIGNVDTLLFALERAFDIESHRDVRGIYLAKKK